MRPKKYITSITAKDMAELAAVTNLEPGFLIRIDRSPDKITIGIDKTAFAQALNGFIRNGGGSASGAAATGVSFDPPS